MSGVVTRRAAWVAGALMALSGLLAGLGADPAPAAAALPGRLSDRAFWELSTSLSEGDGYFPSENLVSNERTYQNVIPALVARVPPGGVYLGVAPDQNFTYVAATRPAMAFILDVRRGNLLQHLLYKGLFELSADRAEFVSRLFSRPRPAGLGAATSVMDLFGAFAQTQPDETYLRRNTLEVIDLLTRRHGLPIPPDDLDRLRGIYLAFYRDGPRIHYARGPGGAWRTPGPSFPTYEELMMESDTAGRLWGYLASEDRFQWLKAFQADNLVVPVVGDFAGTKALRAIGQYVRDHGATVSTFYVSNVEQYLYQQGVFDDFALNVAMLPIDASSTFIRSVWAQFGYSGPYVAADDHATVLDPIRAFVRDFQDGRLPSYYELNARSR